MLGHAVNEVFYLGPAGTFTHDAAQLYFSRAVTSNFEACSTPSAVMHRLSAAASGYGVVPIESSIQGEVIPTVDALCFEFSDIFAVGEVSLPISFTCFGTGGGTTPGVVLSHPHALGQCKRFTALRGLQEQPTSSTTEACRIVAERRDPALCAIASPSAGRRFGLLPLQTTVEDFAGAHTRFLVLSKSLRIGADVNRTMLALVPPSIAAGVIAEFSGSFAEAGVSILEIHTRPLRTGPGHYLFLMTVSGSPAETSTRAVVDKLLARGYGVKLLGAFRGWPAVQPVMHWPNLPGLLDAEGLQQMVGRAMAAAESPLDVLPLDGASLV